MPKIIPNLWFDNQAREAAEYYCDIFPNSQVKEVAHYTEAGPGEPGTVLTVEFQLDDQPYVAINGGPHDAFNDAISLQVDCEDQEELDYYWGRLTNGGTEVQCGWLKDKYGVSWQVVPIELGELVADPDRQRVDRVVRAMLQMKKIDIAALHVAAAGGDTSDGTADTKKSGGGLADAVKNVAKKLTGGGSKKPPAKKTPAKQQAPAPTDTAVDETPATRAKKSPPKQPPATKTAAKKPPATKTAAKKPPATKPAAKKPSATKTAAKKSSVKQSPATKSAAKKSPAKKVVAKRR